MQFKKPSQSQKPNQSQSSPPAPSTGIITPTPAATPTTNVPDATNRPPAGAQLVADAEADLQAEFHTGTVPSGDSETSEAGTAEAPPTPSPSALAVAPSQTVYSPSALDEVARRAVQTLLDEQADAARYDVYDNRTTVLLDDEDLAHYRTAWVVRNSQQPSKVTFSEYLSARLKACRSHISSRPVFIDDTIRQYIEDLFGDMVTSGQDLANKIDRHIRPIIESPDLPDGIMCLKPLDPVLIEMVTGWEPDKTAAEALGDFILEAAMQKAGLA